MSQFYDLNDEYTIVSYSEERIRLFRTLHAMAPLLKIVSVGMVLLAWIKNFYIFILAVALWIASVVINYVKWKLNFSFLVTVKNERCTLVKRYNVIKNIILADYLIKDIEFCDIILPDEVKETDILCFSMKILPDLILRIKFNENPNTYCIGADRYLYSRLKQMEFLEGKL